MKFIIAAITISLLAACTTNNFVDPAKVCAMCKPTEKVEKVEKAEVLPVIPGVPILPPEAKQQGWLRNTKSVLCGPPKDVIKGVKSYGETPFMLWEDPILKSTVMLFRNVEKDTLTLIENPNPVLSCILSAGSKVHIEGSFLQQKSREVKKGTDLKVLQIKNE